MTMDKQEKGFSNDLKKLINLYCLEFDLPISSMIGLLEEIKLEMIMSELEKEND
jgi:hypothetical protein